MCHREQGTARNPGGNDRHDQERNLIMNESKSATQDPVCGMTVDASNALHAERAGKTFHFCSDHCLQKFLSTGSGAKPAEKPGCCCG